MIELPQTYRTPFWMIGLVLLGLGISIAGFLYFRQEPDEHWTTLGFGGLVVAFALGLADALTCRVWLAEESLEVRSNFRRRKVSPSEVVRVVAEKGAPVSSRSVGRLSRWPCTTKPCASIALGALRRKEPHAALSLQVPLHAGDVGQSRP